MPRTPKGIYQLNTPDFWWRRTMMGGAVISGDGVHVFAAGLYNNATDGTNLLIYSIDVSNFNEPDHYVFSLDKGPIGTQVGNAQPIYSGSPAVPGLIYSFPQTTNHPTFGGYVIDFVNVEDDHAWQSEMPIGVVGPGWQFDVYQDWTVSAPVHTTDMPIGFYWVAIKGD